MKQRRLLRFHGLKRPRVRQTWNKYNLFNLVKLRTPNFMPKTFFQQKWIAKSMTRGYHGEHIKEYQWERMFSRRPLSAVNMDPAYMARRDGSEQAAGRGSGLSGKDDSKDKWAKNRGNLDHPTPYMQMTFAPMERRLDIAIFRALFASSARQARQFVLHGAVTVNGKKMLHPSYLLNPGDMFQVDIERVMTATGKQKPSSKEARKLPKPRLYKSDAARVKAEPASTEAAEAEEAAEEELDDDEAIRKQNIEFYNELKKLAYSTTKKGSTRLRAKQKQQLRELVREMQSTLGKAVEQPRLWDMLNYIRRGPGSPGEEGKSQQAAAAEGGSSSGAAEGAGGENTDNSKAIEPWMRLQSPQRRAIRRAFKEAQGTAAAGGAAGDDNPYDPSKPYLTPWQPRDWMSPFAFIPRYLEVNQKICAAVYLRHPVARPGISEVPTPFSPRISQLAFNWYLRRS